MKRITVLLLSFIFILTFALSGCKSDPCKKGHNYGGWNFVAPATCTTAGERVRYCLNEGCGHKETQVLNALGHDYQLIQAREATCWKVGCIEHKECSRCDSLLLNDQPAQAIEIFSNKIDHDYLGGSSQVTVQPGQNTEGKRIIYCKYFEQCGGSKEESIPAGDDNPELWTPPV